MNKHEYETQQLYSRPTRSKFRVYFGCLNTPSAELKLVSCNVYSNLVNVQIVIVKFLITFNSNSNNSTTFFVIFEILPRTGDQCEADRCRSANHQLGTTVLYYTYNTILHTHIYTNTHKIHQYRLHIAHT